MIIGGSGAWLGSWLSGGFWGPGAGAALALFFLSYWKDWFLVRNYRAEIQEYVQKHAAEINEAT